MPQHLTLRVPPEEAELVLEALLAVYAARATNLADEVAQGDAARAQDARAALAETGRMLDVFGWERGRRTRAAELAGPEPDVGEVLRGAVGDAHEALGRALEAYHRGGATLEALLGSAHVLRGVLDRFFAFEREHAL